MVPLTLNVAIIISVQSLLLRQIPGSCLGEAGKERGMIRVTRIRRSTPVAGISNLDKEGLSARVSHFKDSYVSDWKSWVVAVRQQKHVAHHFGAVLRRWQACRRVDQGAPECHTRYPGV